MIFHVSPSSSTPMQDAIDSALNSGYMSDADGREYSFEEHGPNGFMQCFNDDLDGEDTIYWSFSHVGNVTPGNTLEVHFSC